MVTAKQTERARRLFAVYGLTQDAYDTLLERQHRACVICGMEHSDAHPLVVDHNHETMKVRGLLCSNCNSGLGLLDDNIATLASAIVYLHRVGEYESGGPDAPAQGEAH